MGDGILLHATSASGAGDERPSPDGGATHEPDPVRDAGASPEPGGGPDSGRGGRVRLTRRAASPEHHGGLRAALPGSGEQ
jgi:hypothetical protein